MILHYCIAAVMATEGWHVDSVGENENLKWEVTGAPGKAVIALSYIFVGVYGATWVCWNSNELSHHSKTEY